MRGKGGGVYFFVANMVAAVAAPADILFLKAQKYVVSATESSIGPFQKRVLSYLMLELLPLRLVIY